MNCNDKEVIDFLLLKSNEFSSNGKLEYELTEVDQVPIGIMYINLYKISRNKEFLDVARSVFDYLNEKESMEAILFHTVRKVQTNSAMVLE